MGKELSIRIYTDGFSFSTPESSKEVTARGDETLLEALDAAFKQSALLHPDYDEVHIYADYPSTRIPLDEFRSEEARSIYRLTFGEDSLAGMNMHYEMLPALEVIEVFVIDAQIEELILRHYPHATIHSYFGQLINHMLAYEKRHNGEVRRLYAHSNGRQLFIFAYDKGRLSFANSFDTNDLNNELYFLLYVWKQLGMRQRKDECVIVGDDPDFRDELRKYILNIRCV